MSKIQTVQMRRQLLEDFKASKHKFAEYREYPLNPCMALGKLDKSDFSDVLAVHVAKKQLLCPSTAPS